MAEAAKGGEQRGRWWRRVWAKLKHAVFRPKIAPPKSTSDQPMPMAEPQPPSAAVDSALANRPNSTEGGADYLDHSRASFTIINSSLLTADESIGTDDSPAPLLSMLSTRTSLSNERAQLLFEKYGIKLEPRTTSKEGEATNTIRRVEKPIRVRVHYSCEECGTSFGSNKNCSQCGHRRCRDCPRSPAKRVRELLDEVRQQPREHREEVAQRQHQSTYVPFASNTIETNDNALQLDPAEPLVEEQEGAGPTDPASSTQIKYVASNRSRTGVEMLLRPTRVQLVRRICHECETHFEPATAKCPTCNHVRCKLCRYAETATQETLEDEQQESTAPPRVVATVQRVFKRPRQRVRWFCDQCEALFTDRDRCQECGHNKCESCVRDPPRRTPRPPDPEVEQVVEDKLSILDDPPSSQRGEASDVT